VLFSLAASGTGASTTPSIKPRCVPSPKAQAAERSTTSGALRVIFTTKPYAPSLAASSASSTAASPAVPTTTSTLPGPTATALPPKKFNKLLDALRPWGV
jgi:hypothetical protein